MNKNHQPKELNVNNPSRTVFGESNHRLLAMAVAAMLPYCGSAILTWAGELPQAHPVAASMNELGQPEPWTEKQLRDPAALAKSLRDPTSKKPVILDIGPASWIRGGRIKDSIVVGPAREAQNLEKLRAAVSAYPKNADLLIYCGCCPFKDCPNIRPAFKLLNEMKFTQHKLLNLPHNLKTDWINRGFPTEK